MFKYLPCLAVREKILLEVWVNVSTERHDAFNVNTAQNFVAQPK